MFRPIHSARPQVPYGKILTGTAVLLRLWGRIEKKLSVNITIYVYMYTYRYNLLFIICTCICAPLFTNIVLNQLCLSLDHEIKNNRLACHVGLMYFQDYCLQIKNCIGTGTLQPSVTLHKYFFYITFGMPSQNKIIPCFFSLATVL